MDEPHWVVSGTACAIEQRDRLLLVGADGSVRALDGEGATFARAVLELLDTSRSRSELLALVSDGAPTPEAEAVLDALLGLLRSSGAIRAAGATPVPRPLTTAPGARVVLGVTGAVGTLTAPAVIQSLQRRGCEVRVMATRNALRFVSIAGVEALTHHRLVRSMWSRDPSQPVPHLALAAWADAVVLCPVSAATLARLAAGDHGDVVAATALVARVPVILAPSMNPAMLAEPAVQRNLDRLRDDGFYIVPPGPGVEVAEAPAERAPNGGGAPPPERLADLVIATLRAQPPRPRPPIDWDRVWADHLPPAHPTADPDMVDALLTHARPRAPVLDIGTGTGALAVHAARAGHPVVATDLSRAALDHARAAAAELPVTFVRDDITDSRLESRFAAVLDRGCYHHLLPADLPRWAATVVRLTEPGGTLIVKTDAPDAPSSRNTRRTTPDDLVRLLAPAFTLVTSHPSSFMAGGQAIPASVIVLRRVTVP